MTQILGTILLGVIALVCVLVTLQIQWLMDEDREYKDGMKHIKKEEEENE